ncbi:MAG: hypothetical protein K6347_06185, partial [Campylobacterales bacterium]
QTITQELHVYDFLDPYDYNEVIDYLKDLNSQLLLFENSTLELEDTMQIADYLGKLASILSSYTETYTIASAIRVLAEEIRQHADKFVEHADAIGPLFKAFVNDLNYWRRLLFEEGAPRVDVLDQTIVANAGMIQSFIAPPPATEGSLDDIFDF